VEAIIPLRVSTFLTAVAVANALVVPTAARAADRQPEVILELPWGDSGAAAGRRDGNESSPEGPMSFAIGPDGEIYLLDQVNHRVLAFDRERQLDLEMTLPADTFQDIEIAKDGALLVVDRLVRSSILVLDEAGATVGEYGVLGDAIPEGGGISATFVHEDGVWLEWAHTYAAHVLDEQLQPCNQTTEVGRILRGGDERVVAALDGWGGASVWIEPTGSAKTVAELFLDPEDRIDRIIWIEADEVGHVVVALHLWPRSGRPFQDYVEVMVLDRDLEIQESFRSPYAIVEWAQFREFKLTPEGDLIQMAFTNRGVKLLRWSLP